MIIHGPKTADPSDTQNVFITSTLLLGLSLSNLLVVLP
jgi:hypothetical protein